MIVNILAIGDVVGANGLDFLSKKLRAFKKFNNVSFTVVNGENASVVGLTPRQADDIFSAGADVITLGNHSFSKRAILPYLDENGYILRPSNFSSLAVGRGWGDFETNFGTVRVINLIGRCGMDFGPENPFHEADRILKADPPKITLIDFHAEATSEKLAMAYYLDGRVTALWGTHTHVQTSDGTILKNGTGVITDLGMTGAINSVLGVEPRQSIANFRGESERFPYEAAKGPCKMEGALLEVDTETGKCLSVEAIRITE